MEKWEWVLSAIGGLILVLLGVIGWFAAKWADSVVGRLDGMQTDMQSLTLQVNGYEKLTEYQNERIEALEKENGGFRRYFNAVDRLMYRRFGEEVPTLQTD